MGFVVIKPIIALVLAAVLTGCVTIGPPVKPMALREEQRRAVEVAIRKLLKNPDTARFGKLVAGTDDEGRVVACGTATGTNAIGLSLTVPFIGHFGPDGTFVIERHGTASYYATTDVYGFCRLRGLSVS